MKRLAEQQRVRVVIGTSSDGMIETTEDEYRDWQRHFGAWVKRLLADYGYQAEALIVEKHEVQTRVLAREGLSEREMANMIGADAWDALIDGAAMFAWDEEAS